MSMSGTKCSDSRLKCNAHKRMCPMSLLGSGLWLWHCGCQVWLDQPNIYIKMYFCHFLSWTYFNDPGVWLARWEMVSLKEKWDLWRNKRNSREVRDKCGPGRQCADVLTFAECTNPFLSIENTDYEYSNSRDDITKHITARPGPQGGSRTQQ